MAAQQRHSRGSLLLEGTQHTLRRFTGAENQYRAVANALAVLRGDLDCCGCDRRGMPAQKGLPADSPASGERTGKNQVHFSSGGPGLASNLVRPAHLPQNFGLTENLGVESSGNPEKMTDRVDPVVLREAQRSSPIMDQLLKPPLLIQGAPPVKLEAIAGRKEKRRTTGPASVREQLAALGGRKRQALPLCNRRGMMAEAKDMELKVLGHVQR
jgi:hypothetical protein